MESTKRAAGLRETPQVWSVLSSHFLARLLCSLTRSTNTRPICFTKDEKVNKSSGIRAGIRINERSRTEKSPVQYREGSLNRLGELQRGVILTQTRKDCLNSQGRAGEGGTCANTR